MKKVQELQSSMVMADVIAVASQPELPALQYRLKTEFHVEVDTVKLMHAVRKMWHFNLLDSTQPLSKMGDYARRTLAAMCAP